MTDGRASRMGGRLKEMCARVLAVTVLASVVVVGGPPVQAHAEPVVNVRDHGATGDGVTDDSAAIRAAMAAGGSPKTVTFPAGTYVFENISVSSGTHIVFESGARGLSPLDASPESSFFSIMGSSSMYASDVSLSGGTFEGRPRVRGVFVALYAQNLRVSGVSSLHADKNVGTDRCRDVVVESCSAEDGLIGFAFQESERVTINASRSVGMDRDGILFYKRSRYCIATNNYVSDYHRVAGTGVGGIQAYGSTDATFTGNTVTNGHNDSAGIRFRDAERFWCADNYVSDPGSSAYQVHRIGDFPPIEGGDGVFLHNTAVRSRLRGIDAQDPLTRPVRIIDNLVLDTTSANPIVNGTGIIVGAPGSVVVGNRIERSTGPGIEANQSSQLVGWNTVRDPASVNFGPRVGIFANGSDSALSENDIGDSRGYMVNGIRLYAGSALIRGNVVRAWTNEPLDVRGTRLSVSRSDRIPPQVTAAYSAGPRSLSVRATDTGSGVAAVRVSVDGAAFVTYPGSAVSTTLASGAETVRFEAMDLAGNVDRGETRLAGTQTGTRDVTGPGSGVVRGSAIVLNGALVDAGGAPVADAPVRLEHWSQSTGLWVAGSQVCTTSLDGGWTLSAPALMSGPVRARYQGDSVLIGCVSPLFDVNVTRLPILTVPLGGADRIGTAIEVSKQAFPQGGAEQVVIATSANWPDALGGSALAGVLDAPVLLTTPNGLSAATAEEIGRLGASKAVILGGTGAVSANVQRSLEVLLGTSSVSRLGGGDRYSTARLIAQKVIGVRAASPAGFDGTVFVATGANFPDALGASPIAAANGWPILLLPRDQLEDATVSLMKTAGVKRAIILGGMGAIFGVMQTALGQRVGCKTQRISGSDRYATAVAVASYGVFDAGLEWDGVAIATGASFPDALAGGVLQGRSGSVMLLTPTGSLDSRAAGLLAAQKSFIGEVRFLGGTGALSVAVRNSAVAALN